MNHTNLILAVFLFSAVLFIGLFGQLPTFSSGPVGVANRFLLKSVPAFLAQWDLRFTGGRVIPWLTRFGQKAMGERHPAVLLFYLLVMGGGVVVFFMEAFSFLPRAHQAASLFVIPTPFVALWYCASADPGYITEANYRQEAGRYAFDEIIFFPQNTCRTCRWEKPARSKHCSLCRHCIALHDHHCSWINNCIGRGNIASFITFLLLNLLFVMYGAFLSGLVIKGFIREYVRRKGRQFFPFDRSTRVRLWWMFVWKKTGLLGALFVLCIMSSMLVLAFLSHQLYLLAIGCTTNESAKWADVQDAIKHDEILEIQGWDGSRKIVGVNPDGSSSHPIPVDAKPRHVRSLAEVDNIYDRGVWRNLVAIFGGDVHSRRL